MSRSLLIGIDASRANRFQKTGVEWYSAHLIRALERLPRAQDHSWLLYTPEPLRRDFERMPAGWHEAVLPWPPRMGWTQVRLSWEMMRHPPSVLFVPAHVLPRVIPKQCVVTIHDIGFHARPDLYCGFHHLPRVQTAAPQRWLAWSTRDIVRRASRILTVSKFTKQALVEAYQMDPDRIVVTPLGIDHDRYVPQPFERSVVSLAHLRIPTPFLVFVGRLERKKNVATLIEAFERYKHMRGADDTLQLVLAGVPGAGFEECREKIRASAHATSIHIIGYVSEEEKIHLLSTAHALVHPSWYEGFGLTPLEAMACGCPVVCARSASLPEVVGDEQALWFDPADADACAAQIDRVTHDEALRTVLRERGLAWVKQYQWERTAEQTLEALTQ